MDFASIWESIAGLNPMFLAASGSVALGVSLIVTAGMVQFKRFRNRPITLEVREISDQPVEVECIPEVEAPPVDSRQNPKLCHLLTRLRLASAKLEKFRVAETGHAGQASHSGLKKPPSGVDYIFRAGTG